LIPGGGVRGLAGIGRKGNGISCERSFIDVALTLLGVRLIPRPKYILLEVAGELPPNKGDVLERLTKPLSLLP